MCSSHHKNTTNKGKTQVARNSRMFNDAAAARRARNNGKAAPEPQPVKTPELIEATYKRLLEYSSTNTKKAVDEAKSRLNKVMAEFNDPAHDDRNLWSLESMGDRIETVTVQSISLSVIMNVQEELQAEQQNGKSFREACRRVRERLLERSLSRSEGYSSSEYRNAHNSVKAEALRSALRDAIRALGFVIDELDSIVVEPKVETVS